MPTPIEVDELAPFWQAPGGEATLYHGHILNILSRMPSRSVQCCVTSPPYWGLRSYNNSDNVKHLEIGAEETPEEYVAMMVEVFHEVRRVLRRDGTLWLNLGDTFLDDGQFGMIPAQTAIALQSDGWTLRNDIIWYAPNKMPESVTNRCSKSHEHIFLLTQEPDYYFDHHAIKVEGKGGRTAGAMNYRGVNGREFLAQNRVDEYHEANKRDVWIVPINGYKGAHFATYSPELITPCILAGTSEYGCCSSCGICYNRVVERKAGARVDIEDRSDRDRSVERNRNGITGSLDGEPAKCETVGWAPGCTCEADVVPCTVLDPFVGSGTTPATSITLGRRGIGIDLSDQYLREHAIPRIEAAISTGKVPRKSMTLVEPLPAGEAPDDNGDIVFGDS
jgi:DNA modification methylase